MQQQFLAVLDSWWITNPVLTVVFSVLGAVLVLLLLLPPAIIISPRMRIYYRAIRRILWIKFGERQDGATPKAYRAHLDTKRNRPLLIAVEGAAFGRTGVVYLTPDEIGFVAFRFGMLTEMNVPYAQISEAMISKGALYDRVTVTTRERAEVLRIYRAHRDVGQEFFNHLQMRLGAMRFRRP